MCEVVEFTVVMSSTSSLNGSTRKAILNHFDNGQKRMTRLELLAYDFGFDGTINYPSVQLAAYNSHFNTYAQSFVQIDPTTTSYQSAQKSNHQLYFDLNQTASHLGAASRQLHCPIVLYEGAPCCTENITFEIFPALPLPSIVNLSPQLPIYASLRLKIYLVSSLAGSFYNKM